jgi:hypothetical protein
MQRFLAVTLIVTSYISTVSAQSDNSATARRDNKVVLSDTVTGNQEQPKVLYIVPWRPAQDDTILNRPLNTNLHQDVFAHIEKTEHMRELEYLKQLAPQSKR